MVEDLLDLGNAGAVLNAVLTGSGLKPCGKPPGEAVAVASLRLWIAGRGWGYIYGLLATACGYSYPVIDEMTLLDFEELAAYWVEHPPVHILVAAYLGLGSKKLSRSEASDSAGKTNPGSMRCWLGLGAGFSSRDVHADLGPAELDFEELRKAVMTRG